MRLNKFNIEDVKPKWVVEHKLRTVGCLWLSGISGSIAYNWSRPNMKTSVKIIHASERSRESHARQWLPVV
ncbi:hypothetical protein P8452_74290 [Trifolium repens]|nr:hypothetical protein P8452_74290 [Trifolium repens]